MDNANISGRFWRGLIIVAGIFIGQAILYGPSLLGQKILLPLDLLARPGVWVPQSPEIADIVPRDVTPADLVLQFEPDRHFANSEIHAGRFPLWEPNQFGGAPFVWPKFSPFLFLEYCVASPVILPWVNFLMALAAGAGFYFFCRRALQISFWPAAICSWCYPLTAFFVLWQGFPTGLAVYWLPWIFLAVDRTIRSRNIPAVATLSATTFLTLVSGHIDVAGQVLIGSGIFAIWTLWDAHRGDWFGKKIKMAIALLVIGWTLGFFLAAPHLLPLLEYAQTGERMAHRGAGAEERPPAGLAALPEIVLPDINGTSARNSLYLTTGNLLESASAGYSGAIAALLIAPLAWCSRRRRAANIFFLGLAIFGLSWQLNLPGFVELLRLPGLKMMSHNRLVFLTAFAILAMVAIGLENLLNNLISRRKWFWLPAGLLAALCGWCFYRSIFLPESIAVRLERGVLSGKVYDWVNSVDAVHLVQGWFILHYTVSAIFCGLGFLGWLLLWRGHGKRIFPMLAIFMAADLLWFDFGRSTQSNPALFFPHIPVLKEIAQAAPGRIIGCNCLPASLAVMAGLRDVRGYDSIDPARMVELLKTTAVPDREPKYAQTQFLEPKEIIDSSGAIHLPPALDMLNVCYVIFRGVPPDSVTPAFSGNDYWVMINSNALPRAFVPASVETITNAAEELEKLSSTNFNPRATVFVKAAVALPDLCRGDAAILAESPTDIKISVQMQTAGLVVLADNWDKGWHAYYNGKLAPILRADYTIRGVVVPVGNGVLEFIYRPASLILGLWLAGFAAIILFALGIIYFFRQKAAVKSNLKIDHVPSRC